MWARLSCTLHPGTSVGRFHSSSVSHPPSSDIDDHTWSSCSTSAASPVTGACSRTSTIWWSGPFTTTRWANARVTAMCSRRFTRLIAVQVDRATRSSSPGPEVDHRRVERGRVVPRGIDQRHEARDVPALEVLLGRVEVDRDVETVGSSTERVDALEHDHLDLRDRVRTPRQHVVDRRASTPGCGPRRLLARTASRAPRNAGTSYDSGKPLRASSPCSTSVAFGRRKPSVETISTRSPRRSSAAPTSAANVDFPTDTAPAMPTIAGRVAFDPSLRHATTRVGDDVSAVHGPCALRGHRPGPGRRCARRTANRRRGA